MPQLEQSLGKYSLVAASDHEAEIDIEKPGSNVHEKRRKLLFRLTSTHLISLVCLALVVTGGLLLWSHGSISNLQAAFSPPASLCKNPSTRREWRALSHSQKAEYIQAVQCLTSTKSIMGLNQTVHDDFSWVHSHVGNNCEANLRLIKTVKMLIRGSFLQAHDSAAFIAWHRYFIHVYEQTLRHHCGYTGFLTYATVIHPLRLSKTGTDTALGIGIGVWIGRTSENHPSGIAKLDSVVTAIPAKANQSSTDTASKMVPLRSSKSSISAKSTILIVYLAVSKAVKVSRTSAQSSRPRLSTK